MRIRLLLVPVLTCLLASCGKSVRAASSKTHATEADAKAFLGVLESQLSSVPGATFENGSWIGGGNVSNISYSATIKASDWGSRKISDDVDTAVKAWPRFGEFLTRSQGSRGDRAELQFGDESSSDFIDILTIPKPDDQIKILVLIRTFRVD